MGSIAGDDVASNAGGGKEERILVSVRIRPLNEKELEKNDVSDWECINNNTVIFKNTLPERAMYPTAYTFDRVFGCDNDTKQVYEEGAKEVALSVVSGINSSIFAYGQTSSGKTYTMTGITEYSVSEIYDHIEKHPEREFVLKFSAMEIYNESVKDLLNPDSGQLRLLDDPEKGTIVEKLTEEMLRDEDHLKELLHFCEAQRQMGETSLNEMSSRSHQILRLNIESSAREFVGKNNFSTLMATVNFVDLAGSERASQALTAGSRLKEGCHINRSLLTLGTVIRKLSKGRNGHVPYRDSKLTRILQSSLGGNARTAIICTMSPARSHIEQSRNTLQFAICAKEVVTSAQVNVIMSDKTLVKHLRKELARLENEMKYMGSNSLTPTSDVLREKEAQIKKMEKEMKELMKQRDLAQSRLEDLLRAVGDDRASGQWEELSPSLLPHAPQSYEETLSVSETSGISYQIPEYGVSHVHSDSKLCSKTDNQHTISPLYHSASTPIFINQEEVSPLMSPDFEEHFKEVCCIEMIEPSMNKVEDFNLLLNENIDSFLPPIVDGKEQVEHEPIDKAYMGLSHEPANEVRLELKNEPKYKAETMLEDESKYKIETELNDELKYKVEAKFEDQPVQKIEMELKNEPVQKVEMELINEQKVEMEFKNEPLQKVEMELKNEPLRFPLAKDLGSFKRPPLIRSRSCRASLLNGASSPWFEETEEYKDTPSQNYLKDYPEIPRGSQKMVSVSNNYEKRRHARNASGDSEESVVSEITKPQNARTSHDGKISRVYNSVDGLKDMAQIQYQKELSDDQELKYTTNEDDSEIKITIKDVCLDPVLKSSESKSRWKLEFEKKQQEIVELWHACNVSLIHRSYFFLLIKGDPADSIYMEVEHRRLSFLKKSISQGSLDKAIAEENVSLELSQKNIRREREKLCRVMNRMRMPDREVLYKKWGIELNSKQRRLQIARKVWTETKDMDHVRESAMLVAKLFGFFEPGLVPKEMFGLSFAPRLSSNRSYSWKTRR